MAHEFARHKQDKAGSERAEFIVKQAGYAERNASKQDKTDPANKVNMDNLKGTDD
jgi:hypothetical protein